MTNTHDVLVGKFHRMAQLEHALTFLQWDQLVMMPPKGNEARAESVAELVAMHHELLTADDMKELLGKAQDAETDPARKRSLLEMERSWKQAACLPGDLVKAKSLAGSQCEHGWRTQRRENDWDGFLANFREVVNLSRQEAQARYDADSSRFATPYDALLDLYCTGDSSSLIGGVFETLKDELPSLIEAILDRQQDSFEPISGNFSVEEQTTLNRRLMESLGFDFEGGRADVSMHPFSTGGPGDQRITTRFRESEFLEALLATAHETGHASYESGLPPEWRGLPAGQARNMCVHESQSLLFEKQLFLSRPFISFFVPEIHRLLPTARSLNEEQIWAVVSRVEKSLIRVEADEATYPLHVILRFEIERDLMNGVCEADDIPDLWDEKMKRYLGLSTAGNYCDGCMQDIHWTDGSFGYFPSYTLGALNGAQLFSSVKKQFPEWEERLAAGEVGFVRDWLSENIWQKGSTMDSQDIIAAATGEGTHPRYFLDHLKNRYLAD